MVENSLSTKLKHRDRACAVGCAHHIYCRRSGDKGNIKSQIIPGFGGVFNEKERFSSTTLRPNVLLMGKATLQLGTCCSLDNMHFLKCSKSNGLVQGFPGGKEITIWPLLSSLFSKSSYLRAPGADSWKSSTLHPSQNDLSFHILLAHNGATSAPLTPHQPEGEGPHQGKPAPSPLLLRGKGEAKGAENDREKSEWSTKILCQPK